MRSAVCEGAAAAATRTPRTTLLQGCCRRTGFEGSLVRPGRRFFVGNNSLSYNGNSSSSNNSSRNSNSNPAATRRDFAASSSQPPHSQPHFLLYMWGTDSSGSVCKPRDRRDESMLDTPTRVVVFDELLDNTTHNSKEDDPTLACSILHSVVCGPTDSAILTKNGRCFVMGENKHGHLGLGHTRSVSTPTELTLPLLNDNDNGEQHPHHADNSASTVPSSPDDDTTFSAPKPPQFLNVAPSPTSSLNPSSSIRQVALGSTAAAFVTATGDLYTAGFGGSVIAGGFGQLGHGGAVQSHPRATRVQSLVDDGCRVSAATLGDAHLTVLTTEGEVLTCGAGSYGRLGNFEPVDQLFLEPVEVLTPETGIVQIAGGKSFTLALSKDGVVYGWGRNHKGQLGTGLGLAVDMYAMQAIPEPIDTKELASRNIVSIAAGHSHAAAISDAGELLYWGMALHLEPVVVEELAHVEIAQVACGHDYTLAIDANGAMYSFGIGKTGALGQGSVRRLNQPAIMEAFQTTEQNGTTTTRKVIQASAGWKHAACLVIEETL